MENIKIIYSNLNEENIILNYFNKNIFNNNNKNIGKFIIEKDILIIEWNNKDIFENKYNKIKDNNITTYKCINNNELINQNNNELINQNNNILLY